MSAVPTGQSELDARDAELATLRARVAQLESELAEQAASANAHIVALQRRMYWLDRLELDLDAMIGRRPWLAFVLMAPLKVRRGLRRVLGRLRRRLEG